jgi:hypothetical protein
MLADSYFIPGCGVRLCANRISKNLWIVQVGPAHGKYRRFWLPVLNRKSPLPRVTTGDRKDENGATLGCIENIEPEMTDGAWSVGRLTMRHRTCYCFGLAGACSVIVKELDGFLLHVLAETVYV